MKVKCILLNTYFTVGKWYETSTSHEDNKFLDDRKYYYVRDDSGSIKFMPKYYFITVEEERSNKLNEILS